MNELTAWLMTLEKLITGILHKVLFVPRRKRTVRMCVCVCVGGGGGEGGGGGGGGGAGGMCNSSIPPVRGSAIPWLRQTSYPVF